MTEPLATPRRVWLALGGNQGDRLAQLAGALDALVAGGVAIDRVSRVYETAPWGVEAQPAFANAAVSGTTELSGGELLRLCKRIETAAGRNFEGPRYGPRPVDVDILVMEGETVAEPDLVVPHPRMHERAFVLVPLVDIAPELRHPLIGSSVVELLEKLDQSGVALLAGSGWWNGVGP